MCACRPLSRLVLSLLPLTLYNPGSVAGNGDVHSRLAVRTSMNPLRRSHMEILFPGDSRWHPVD